MAIFNYYNPTFTGNPGLATVSSSPTQISVNFASGLVDSYFGSFVYDADGFPFAGTVTSIQESYGGSLIFTGAGLLVSAPQLAAAVLAFDSQTIAGLLFAGSDQITGSVYGDPIVGMGGDDTVIALDGDDIVAGMDGNDDINGNVGRDLVAGGEGADTVRGGKDADTISGEGGDDPHVNGNIGNDLVYGGTGNDTVYGGQDQDTLHGEAGNDVLSGDLGYDILYGEAGADRFALRAGTALDWAADFKAAEGDRILLTPGAAYTVTAISGQVVIDIGGGAQLGLAGVAAGTFSADWIVYG